jgi:hypothetical protein
MELIVLFVRRWRFSFIAEAVPAFGGGWPPITLRAPIDPKPSYNAFLRCSSAQTPDRPPDPPEQIAQDTRSEDHRLRPAPIRSKRLDQVPALAASPGERSSGI